MNDQNTMSYKDWLVTLLLLSVPLLNLVLMIVWAFDTAGNQSRANYCKATLTLVAISVVLGILMSVLLAVSSAALFSSF